MSYAIRLTLNGKRMQSGRTFARKAAAVSFIKNNVPSRFKPSVVKVAVATKRTVKRKPIRKKAKRVTRKRKTRKK